MMKYISSEISLSLNKNKCIGCKMCIIVCPHRVFSFDGKAYIKNKEKCIECGGCMSNCPVGAISVNNGAGCATAILASDKKKKKFNFN